MLIFYLQSQHPEILLPAVDSLFRDFVSETRIAALVEQLKTLPSARAIASTFGTSEGNSVGALLGGFFEFYAQRFNVEDEVISVRTGTALSKTTKWSHAVSWRISIEDPFELAHDVGRVVFHKTGQELLRSEFQRALDMLHSGHRWDDVCRPDATSWNATASCYICRGGDHMTRNCSQLSRHRATFAAAGVSGSDPGMFLADCWYCGEVGHFKANCPLLCFRAIPLPSATLPAIMSPSSTATASTPIAIPKPAPSKAPSPRRGRNRASLWEQGGAAATRSSKRKKRSRHGSLSSPPLHSPASSVSSACFPLEKRHNHQQRLIGQQQPRRALLWSATAHSAKCAAAAAAAATVVAAPRSAEKVVCPT